MAPSRKKRSAPSTAGSSGRPNTRSRPSTDNDKPEHPLLATQSVAGDDESEVEAITTPVSSPFEFSTPLAQHFAAFGSPSTPRPEFRPTLLMASKTIQDAADKAILGINHAHRLLKVVIKLSLLRPSPYLSWPTNRYMPPSR